MKRKRIWLSILALSAAIPLGIWALTIRRVPVSFPGNQPSGRFVFTDEFEGSPMVDWKLPGGHRITYPIKRKLSQRAVDPKSICGYWEPSGKFDILRDSPTISIDGESFFLPVSTAEDPNAKTVPTSPAVTMRSGSVATVRYFLSTRGAVVPSGKPLIALPYVTDEKYSNATLVYGNKRFSIKLPVRKDLGEAGRRTTLADAGPYQLEFAPMPWKVSTDVLKYQVKVKNAKPGQEFQLSYSQAQDKATPYRISWGQSIMFAGSGEVAARRTAPGLIDGKIQVLEQQPVKLIARRVGKRFDLYWPDGKTRAWSHNASAINRGFVRWNFRGLNLSSGVWQPEEKFVQAFKGVKDGEIIEGYGLKVLETHSFKSELDTPPPFKRPDDMIIYASPGGTTVIRPWISPVP